MKKLFTLLTLLTISNFTKAQITLPYFEDFESGTSLWTDTTISGSAWNIITPVGAVAHSGSKTLAIGYDGSNYQFGTQSMIESPVMDFSTLTNPYISFWKYQNTESAWDGTRLEYSLDAGISWNVCGNVGSGYNWYNDSSLNSSALPAWTGTDSSWKNSIINIPAVAGQSNVKLRFAFTSDSSVDLDGFLVDDIFIGEGTGNWMYATHNYSQPCGSQNVDFNLWGFGSIFTGTINVNINFGDGNDTTFQTTVTSGSYNTTASHYYLSTGLFSTQIILSDGSGNADTLVQYNSVNISDNCGNISGMVYNDNNNDCAFNTGDTPINNFPVMLILPGGQSFTTFTDSAGNYFFQGNAAISYTVQTGYYPMLGYNSICPASGQYITTLLPSTGNDFAVYCASDFDLSAYIWGGGFVPGQTATITGAVHNNSCQIMNGSVEVILDNNLTYVNANPAPTTVNGNTLTWNYTSLLGGDYLHYFITATTDTTVMIGDTICNSITANPVTGDNNPADNYDMQCRAAGVSFDPNEKTVSPEGDILLTTELLFTIFFQNTGTATAYNINIFDTLSAGLDLSTFRVIDQSHPVHTNIYPGNRLHFAFNNILLPDSNVNEPLSHGYVAYSIKPLSILPQGSVIENTAHIFFDFNPAIVTNTTFNQIDLGLSVAEMNSSNGLILYPNPASDYLNLTISKGEKTASCLISIYDVLGKEVYSAKMSGTHFSIPVNGLQKGVYFGEIKSNIGVYRLKFVKQ